ncbi:hypothetical protein IRJ41_002408 [Triplophysa rosa]|uniref:Uncharacterized protein n=1 Tax=Triplophysa rosa TaxID=992332 RepID=A0A9W7X4Z8_TRIRA|nr:hypothetical protein IRJ41_002408 [Triplophysa rosa]
MQTVLHISKSAIQKIVEQLHDILDFSKCYALDTIREILAKHNIVTDNNQVVQDITDALFQTNPLFVTTSAQGKFATDYRRNVYFKEQFELIEPIEYLYDRTQKNAYVYVSTAKQLECLLGHRLFLDKVVFNQESLPGQYKSFQDGRYYKENKLLGEKESNIALGLYIDDFEVCNPLGTSRKIHKITAVYWVILNLSSKCRSSLNLINLAVLGKTDDVRLFGYEKFLDPLVKDIKTLEQVGIFVPALQQYVKGTVFCVCADNLGAHGLAGFQESFIVDNFCRFCLISHKQLARTEPGDFKLRSPEQHNSLLKELQNDDQLRSLNGVKKECALSKHLSYFHPITGFPADVLHDFFEGIVPLELSLCLKDLISKRFISFEEINSRIKSFPYKNADCVNKPQKIPKSSFAKGTIGGNGHENWTLLRLLPLMIGSSIPENDPAWEILMDLKDIVELVVSTKFSDETLCYLESKIAEHRKLLAETFPNFSIRPKHHFVDHYPHLIRCFGPLVDLWTMRFEAKHSFFKKVVHGTHNFKNVLLSLATKHQQIFAYFLDGHSLFKPQLYVEKLKVVETGLLDTTLRAAVTKKVSSTENMVLPEFYRIVSIIVVDNSVSFISDKLSSWYLEHYRCFELVENIHPEIDILDPESLNDLSPLLYNVLPHNLKRNNPLNKVMSRRSLFNMFVTKVVR